MGSVGFYSKEIDFSLRDRQRKKAWIESSIKSERKKLVSLSFIFCSDSYLLKINKEFLKHNTLTDTITFSYSDKKNWIEGEVYISIERVKENAAKFNSYFEAELRRVMIHGTLHLCGYSDNGLVEKAEMNKKEYHYLSLYKK